jgi:hypothetical protein
MRAIATLSALCLALPAAAQAVFSPPQGCTGKLTVQHRMCMVVNVWTCETDAPGEQWVAVFSEAGPFQVRKIDDEFQWLETYYVNPVRVERMVVPAADDENLTALFADGVDPFDFMVIPDPDPGTGPLRYVGYDKLTGATTVVDGETLKNTEYAYEVLNTSGDVVSRSTGRQFVSDKYRLFFFGTFWDPTTPDLVNDASPVEFVHPGEPGFFSPNPKYDCGVVMSQVQPDAILVPTGFGVSR